MKFFLRRRSPVGCYFLSLFFGMLASPGAFAAAIPLSISASGKLTCSNNRVVTLTAITTATGLTTYRWTGPGGYSATGDTVTVVKVGVYRVTAANPAGTGTATVTVTADTTAPSSLTAINSGPLTCSISTGHLIGHSSTPGVSYSWTGPNGFTASSAFAVVNAPGAYLLTVVDSGSGCPATALTNVVIDTATPRGVTAAAIPATAQITCTHPSITLTGGSTTSNVVFLWRSTNGFSATGATTVVTNPLSYTLTATDTTNGCVTTLQGSVTNNINAPIGVSASASDVLSCFSTEINLQGTSTTPGATFLWTGPNGYTANTAVAATDAPGSYTLVVTNPANGCTLTSGTTVTGDTAGPGGLTASNNGPLTCVNKSVTLTSSSTTPTQDYVWLTPDQNFIVGQTVTVSSPGTYTIVVTNDDNGCSSLATTTVAQNVTPPAGLAANPSEPLSCNASSVTVTGTSGTPGVTYLWTGPNGFTTTDRVFHTSVGGVYTLTITNPVNGCTNSKSTTVIEDTAAPAGVTATNSGELTCDATTVTLTGNSTTPGVSYMWIGPNGFFDPEQVSSGLATDSGTYVLIVNNPENGCNGTASTYVGQDLTACEMVRPKVTAGRANGFDDSTSASAASTGSAFAYKVYPNPVSTVAYVVFQASTVSQVSVAIYNTTGVLEKVLFSNVVEAARSYRLMIPAGLAAGIHFCVIRVDGKVYAIQLLFLPGKSL